MDQRSCSLVQSEKFRRQSMSNAIISIDKIVVKNSCILCHVSGRDAQLEQSENDNPTRKISSWFKVARCDESYTVFFRRIVFSLEL